LYNLGKRKGYELVACTHLNAFFVAKEYYPLFEIKDNRPKILYTDTSAQMRIFNNWHASPSGCQKLLWHLNYPIKQEKMQVLPRYLRKFPDNYNRFEFLLFLVYARRYKLVREL